MSGDNFLLESLNLNFSDALYISSKYFLERISSPLGTSSKYKAKCTSSENFFDISISKSITGSLGEVDASPLYGINEYESDNPMVMSINRRNNFRGLSTKNLEIYLQPL